MNLPDTHEKVVKTLMTCETDVQRQNAMRFVEMWRRRLIYLWSNAADVYSRNTFIAYYERLQQEIKEVER